LSTEIEQIEDKIIYAIEAAAPEFAIVETWPDSSDLDDLLRNATQLPACYLIYGGTRFGEKKLIGASAADRDQTLRLTIILENLRQSVQDGQRGAYELIEAIVGNASSAGIIRSLSLAPLAGFLWPVSDDLIAVKYGKFAYGIELVRKMIR
jgi:hypothetical protein